MKRLFQKLLLLSLLLVMLNSCAVGPARSGQQDRRIGLDNCIQPLETFAYSVSSDQNKGVPGQKDFQIPPPWQKEANLPTDPASLKVSRLVNHQTELWLGVSSNGSQYSVYQPATKEWKSVSGEIENSGIYVTEFLVTPDGALWGIWSPNDSEMDYVGKPLLSKFNDQTGRFEFEQATQSIPAFTEGKSKDSYYWSKVLVDNQGIFWVLVPKDAIYSYNPTTQEIERQTEIDEIVDSPTLAKDGSIYYLHLDYVERYVDLITTSDVKIYRFTPTNRRVESISIRLEPWPPFSNILVDHAGRVWAGGLAWREPDNGWWYQLERSPLFITNVQWSGMEYRWQTPEILMESSDQRLWFRSDNGLTWLDLSKKTWCWITTSQSNIIEDPQHNLWIIAYGGLYRSPLKP